MNAKPATLNMMSVIPYNEYMRRIRITFGNDSKEILLVSMLYNEVTARDNFGELFIANTPQRTDKPE